MSIKKVCCPSLPPTHKHTSCSFPEPLFLFKFQLFFRFKQCRLHNQHFPLSSVSQNAFFLLSCVNLIPHKGSYWRGQLFISIESVSRARVCPAAGSGSWPLQCLRGMCNRDVQGDKYMHRLKREMPPCQCIMPGCGLGPHIDCIQPVCLSGVTCHSLLTTVTCKMHLTGQEEQQKVGWGGAACVCFCSAAS